MSEKKLKVKIVKNKNLDKGNVQPFNQYQFIKDIHECQMVLRTYRLRLDKLVDENKKLMDSIVPFKDSPYYKNYRKEYIDTDKPEGLLEEFKATYRSNVSFFEYAIDEFRLYPIKLTLLGVFPAFLINIILIQFTHSTNILTISIGILIALLIYFVYFNKGLKEEREAYKREYDNTIEAIEQAKINTESNEKAYNYWKKEYLKYRDEQKEIIDNKTRVNKQEIQFLVDEYKRIKEIINQMYNLRINGKLCLHPNYRGFVPISIIYGYFDTGRCFQLEGHEGAYNLYEDEKMKGIIIEKLDSISKQINKLNATMFYVGKTIEECNNRLSDLESASDRMVNSINNMHRGVSQQLNGMSNQMFAIEENTANSAYYAEVGARMTTLQTAYSLLND